MSLIDEALKRAREQTSSPDAAAPPPRVPDEDPWAYAPLPERRANRPALATLAAVAGSFLLLGGAAWFLIRPGRGSAPPAPAPAETPERSRDARSFGSPAPAGTRPPDERSTRSGPGLAAAPAIGSVESGGKAPREARGASGSLPPVAVSTGMASSSPRLATASRSRTLLPTEAQAPAERRPGPPGGRAHTGSFVAPDGTRIELGGIVFSEANPVALVNGRVLPVGAIVGGMTIVAIEENRIELAGEGGRVFLSLR